jgi:hypothetical protein
MGAVTSKEVTKESLHGCYRIERSYKEKTYMGAVMLVTLASCNSRVPALLMIG